MVRGNCEHKMSMSGGRRRKTKAMETGGDLNIVATVGCSITVKVNTLHQCVHNTFLLAWCFFVCERFHCYSCCCWCVFCLTIFTSESFEITAAHTHITRGVSEICRMSFKLYKSVPQWCVHVCIFGGTFFSLDKSTRNGVCLWPRTTIKKQTHAVKFIKFSHTFPGHQTIICMNGLIGFDGQTTEANTKWTHNK